MSEKNPNRFLIFIGAWLSIFLLAVNATFSILSANIAKTHGLSLDSVTLAYPLYLFLFSLIGIFSGRYADKHGCRLVMLVGGVLCGLGWISSGFVTNVFEFYLSFGILTAVGAGIMYNALLTSTLKWFPDKRGLISGLLLSAAAIGPFVLAPLLSYGYEHYTLRITLLIFGLFVIFIPVAFSFAQHRLPEKYQFKEPQTTNTTNSTEQMHLSPSEMLKNGTFYLIISIFMIVALAGNMMIGVQYTIAESQILLPPTVAAFTISITTMMNFIGRLSFGAIFDKIGGVNSLLISLILTSIALLILSFSNNQSSWLFYVAIVILGFAFGGPMVVFPPLTAQLFGTKHLGVNYGIVFFGYSLAAFLGPKIATYFYKINQQFTMAFYSAIGFSIIGILLVVVLKQILNNTTHRRS